MRGVSCFEAGKGRDILVYFPLYTCFQTETAVSNKYVDVYKCPNECEERRLAEHYCERRVYPSDSGVPTQTPKLFLVPVVASLLCRGCRGFTGPETGGLWNTGGLLETETKVTMDGRLRVRPPCRDVRTDRWDKTRQKTLCNGPSSTLCSPLGQRRVVFVIEDKTQDPDIGVSSLSRTPTRP